MRAPDARLTALPARRYRVKRSSRLSVWVGKPGRNALCRVGPAAF